MRWWGLPKGAKTKSPSDIRKICAESYQSVAEAVGKRSDAGKLYEQASKTCCREIAEGSKKLSKQQRAYLWYDFAGEHDLVYSRRQIEEARAIEDELRFVLPRPDLTEVSALRMAGAACMRRLDK